MLNVLKGNKAFQDFISFVGLFTSIGTLLCCAIPSTLVLLGFGASLANLLGEFPQLILVSEHKEFVFLLSSIMLILSFFAQKFSQSLACPLEKKADCEATKSWSKPLFFFSLGINVIGGFYAFVLPRLYLYL